MAFKQEKRERVFITGLWARESKFGTFLSGSGGTLLEGTAEALQAFLEAPHEWRFVVGTAKERTSEASPTHRLSLERIPEKYRKKPNGAPPKATRGGSASGGGDAFAGASAADFSAALRGKDKTPF